MSSLVHLSETSRTEGEQMVIVCHHMHPSTQLSNLCLANRPGDTTGPVRHLLQAALAEPRNERFVLLSETDIPLYPAKMVWLQLAMVWAKSYACPSDSALTSRNAHHASCPYLCGPCLSSEPDTQCQQQE